MQPRNVVERLMLLAETKPDRLALRFLGDGKSVSEQLSFLELDRRARQAAARLQQAGVASGERALLLFPTGIPYVAGFLGCLYAGVVAVPAYPPESAQPQQLARLSSLLLDATPKVVLTEAQYVAPLSAFLAMMGAGPELKILAMDEAEGPTAADFQPVQLAASDLAFLQYTSGSTATPKGVMVGHDNLVANEEVIREAFAISESDTIVTWLPLYHDMGLIGGLLQPLFSGASLVLMSPRHFLERPARWLEAITRYGGTVSGAPDFAYRLCAERVPDEVLAELRLGEWRVAFSGSEPIREATLAAFAERFAAVGFERRALYPCYGLAEATLFVSGAEPGAGFSSARFAEDRLAAREARPSPDGTLLVSSGRARALHALKIVDPETLAPAPLGKLGEVWVSGPSVTHGYWNNPSATQATFPERDGQRWLRSGDLGFVEGGELYVSGRLKDMIIVRGQNLYPQDIERTIEEGIDFVRNGRVAAFGLEEDGVETIGVAAEVSRSAQKLVQPEALAQAVCDAVARAHHEPPSVVLLLNPGGLPKTSSGKLRRSAIHAAFRAGELDLLSAYRKGRVAESASRPLAGEERVSPLEASVAAIWREVLGVAEVLPSDSFFALGGNSLKAVQVVARIERELGRTARPAAIWQQPVLRAFVAALTNDITPVSAIGVGATASELAPLSASQRRFWLLSALRPDSAAYNVQAAVRVRGEFAGGALTHAVQALVRRHAALRTVFESTDEGKTVQQRRLAQLTPDVRELSVTTSEVELRAQAERDALASFDLERGPLLRAIVAERSADEHVLVLTLPHIATDGISMQILFSELVTLASAAGESALAPLSFDYADYARWQHSQDLTGRLTALREKWPAAMSRGELPADRQRRGLPSQVGDSVRFTLSEDCGKRLGELCRARGVTAFSVLLGALGALIYRYTAASQFAVGVPLANRLEPGTLGVVGPFVNTAVVHCQVSGTDTFLDVLTRVHAQGQRLQAEQDLPFESLVDALGIERSSGHTPLFQVMYNHQRLDWACAAGGYELTLLDFDAPATPFDLVLDTYEDESGAIRGRFGYAVDLFERGTIVRLEQHFSALLARLLQNPTLPLGELGLLSAAELAALAAQSPAASGAVELLPAAFARAVGKRAEREAVIGGASRVSYAKLERMARSIAFALASHGVGPETRVGIAAERTPFTVAAMLAVWKAGGAYVPLDPAYPAERLRYMARDAAVSIVLCDRSTQARLELPGNVRRLCLDDCVDGPELESETKLEFEQLAYVIYTSGSTGEPKGVAVSHGALAMHCAAAAALYEMSEADRALHFASMSFDAAVEQWVVPLVYGGGLVLSQGLWTGAETADVVAREQVTVVYPPTSHVTELARFAAEGGRELGVRVCTVGGEAVSRESVELIRRGLAPALLVNGYGPTEAVVTPLLWRAGLGAAFDTTFAPIGNAVGDRSAWVLDRDLQPLPRGAVGELYLGGAGLARGYHARPGLTAERFVPDPFSVRAGGRLYRTGDLARELADGSFEFVGRTDRQVKVRGFRVELEEIEAALLGDEGVRDAAVVLSAPGRLIAYVVLDATDVELDAVVRRLAERLPSYMVPAQFVALAALPRTPNGKVDREALPAPQAAELASTAPETALQAKLLRLFQATLGSAALGIHDNFFEAGGDSISSIQLAGAARKLGLAFSPRQLFEQQTVAGLARAIELGGPLDAEGEGPAQGELTLLPAQLDFFERVTVARHHFNQAVLLELRKPVLVDQLERALEQLLERHDALRLRFDLSGEVPRASYAARCDAARGVLWVRDLEGGDERAQVAVLAQQSFEIAGKGPLLRAVLMRGGSSPSQLLLVFHHLLVDGVSLRIVLEDLEALLLDGNDASRPHPFEKTASLRAWGAALSALATSEVVEAELGRLEAELAAHELVSLSRARGPAAARSTRSQLDVEATKRALHVARVQRLTLQDLLLTAVAAALPTLTQRAANCVEVEGHGRDGVVSLDVSRTVGWFTSMSLAVLVHDTSLRETLASVRATTAGLSRRGVLLGAARYLSTSELSARSRALPEPTLSFNYLGDFSRNVQDLRLFRVEGDLISASVDPTQSLRCPLVLDSYVLDGRLELCLRFDPSVVSHADAERLLVELEIHLAQLSEELAAAPPRLFPGDFPGVALTQAELDALPFGVDEIESIAPLSPAQEGILFHGLEAGAADPYAFQRGFALDGDWDLERLKRAFELVAGAHEALRSAYFWERMGRPIRVTLQRPSIAWSSDELHGLSDADARQRLVDWLAADHERHFDFTAAATLRFHCFRRSASLSWLIWSHHHVALDGWSLSLVISEVLKAYERLSAGSDMTELLRPRRARPGLASRPHEAAEYFRRRLAGFSTKTELAALGAPACAGRYAECALELGVEASRSLRARAQKAGITLNTAIQAAWALALGRRAGVDDVVFGVTLSGRSAMASDAVGLFINTLPMRVRLPEAERVREWLFALQGDAAELREHESASLAEIQRTSEVPDERGLFDSIVVVENYPIEEALRTQPQARRLGLLEDTLPAGTLSVARGRNNYAVSLIVTFHDSISIRLSHRLDRLTELDAQRLLAQLDSLLAALLDQPTRRLGELGLCSSEAAATLSAPAPTRAAPLIVEIFRHAARAKPTEIALTCGDAQLTYAELDSWSERVAASLRSRGVVAEQRVPVVLERSLDFVVGLLGVLKAGAAYVPLDPELPRERLLELTRACSARALIVSRPLAGRLQPVDDLEPCFIEDQRQSAVEPVVLPAIHPEQAAYVIYTSGSTGTPKGVVVSHGALANYVAGLVERLGLPGASMAMASTVSADLGHTALFGALGSQRSLHLIPSEHGFDADAFAASMNRRRPDVLKIVPSHLAGLLQGNQPEQALPELALILGGEAAPPELLRRIRALKPGLRIINHYGPTETTVGVLTHELQGEAVNQALPLGTPLAGSQIYLLDAELNPVPEGIAAELYIGGAGLARGYERRAAATAERFLPDPNRPGERMYRTGDRALLRQGVVEFLGRRDEQVKIRGNRIELGEVKAALLGIDGVSEAVVIAEASDASGRLELLAYYVVAPGRQLSAVELRIALERRLPVYMVPALIPIEGLPLTANGKIDKRRLPRPRAVKREYTAPRNELESALAEIWQGVLRLERVGIHDHFLELGGDSILSLQVIARAKRRKIRISPKLIFERPTIAELAAAITTAGVAAEVPSIPVADRSQPIPLSASQERLWFLSKLEPASRAYTVAGALCLRGRVDARAMQRALVGLVARHEVLRTCFVERDGRLVQQLDAAAALPFEVVDLRGLESELETRLEAATAAPFELERGPLLRAQLFELDDDERVLLLTAHHAVVDGWSMNILVEEFSVLYAAEVGATVSAARGISPLTLQFADFACFEAQRSASEAARSELDSCVSALGSAPSPLNLPFDRAPAATPTFEGAELACGFSPELVASLRRLAESTRATPFMILLAGLAALLHRYTGRRALWIGVPNANRARAETQALVGPLVNTQVFKLEVDPRASFSELVAHVKTATLRAQTQAEVPFERLVERLNPERTLQHSPLFQVMFNHQKRAFSGLRQLPGLEVTRWPLRRRTAQVELLLSTEEDDAGGFAGSWGYASDRFDSATIEGLAAAFERLLAVALSEPETAIGELALLGRPELEQLQAWNATASEFEPGLVTDWLAAAMRRHSRSVALCFQNQSLTYAELEQRVAALATRLAAAGVGPDVIVGIALERSFELVISILAVLRAGGAFLPLDAEYPRERLCSMIHDAGARVVLSTALIATKLGLERAARVLDVEGGDTQAERGPGVRPVVRPQNLAYVMFTSGSTGRPKGAGIPHAGLANRLAWMQQAYRLGPSDRVLQKTPASFDVSVWEFLWPLMVGATLVVAAPGEHRDPARLATLIREQAVTTLHFVPSMLRAFLEYGSLGSDSSITRVIASGEALAPDLARRCCAALPSATLFNLYGPTEASIDVTHFTCNGSDEVVPIGEPIANTSLHVLDAELNVVPLGAAGELYLGGVGLARGYHGRPGLTAERFVPDPVGLVPGARLYRSGDEVRRRRDGKIEYLGRLDQQLKLRGFRIELAEIEAALRALPGVSDAAVSVRSDDGREPQLIAYVVASGAPRTSDALRAELAAVLPDYMIPSLIMQLEALPLTSSGKLDRKALPAPEWQRAERIAPRTELERSVAAIWQEVLQVSEIGACDDFFALGGHSLLAVQVLARLRERLGFAVPLRVLFEATTVERLARALEADGARQASESNIESIASILSELEEA